MYSMQSSSSAGLRKLHVYSMKQPHMMTLRGENLSHVC